MSDLNYFKHITLIEARDAKSLALKLQSIKVAYHLNAVWSDGKKHFAFINAQKPLSVATMERLDQIK